MAAGLGFKTFTTGEVLTAADVNGYLMQGVLVFASAAARNAAITSPQEGQFAFTKDTNGLWYYDGAAWVASGATGDIEGVTAGVGITGGGTSGTVTITNDMATTITAAGDIVVGTGSGTYDNLPIGTTAQVLTADTTVSPYKVKWATPAASSSGLVYVGGTSFSTSSAVNVNDVFSTTYQNYTIVIEAVNSVNSVGMQMRMRVSGADDTSSNYSYQNFTSFDTTNSGARLASQTSFKLSQVQIAPTINNIIISRPFQTASTLLRASSSDTMSSTNIGIWETGGIFSNTTSFTGFTIYPGSGNMTGTVRVYGLANS